MTTTSQIEVDLYRAAHETAVVVDRSALGALTFRGASRLDLLHRMSTQAVKALPPGSGTATILTTDVGRIIDRLLLYATADSVLALTGEGNADFIARYLMRFVFFNDDFQVEDVTGATAVFALYGPQAGQKLGLSAADLPRHHWQPAEIGGVAVRLHRADPIAGDGYLITGAAADKGALLAYWQAADLPLADEAAYDFLRIEAGQPRFGRELTQEYIPLEADLWSDVSFNKGCYIGQEIIARMESRGKLAKRLARLALAGPATPGADLLADGKKAGTLTSVAVGPAGWIGLGYVKTAVLDERLPLWVGETAVRIRE
jgi:tRNA-modifying protein YgfZ